MLQRLKLFCCLACLMLLASNIWAMRHWSERRGVADDLCYLRQAHLFQTSGLRGLDTDIALDTDGYFRTIVSEAGHPDWDQPDNSICHIKMAATDKRVIQYPPGPGFLLALFPEGFQVVPLYAASTALVLVMAMIAIACAGSRAAVLSAAAFGLMALYFMINPAKASYSIPPTMVISAAAGFLTAKCFELRDPRIRLVTIATLGLLLGLSVNLRIPNLLLSAGYFGFFAIMFVMARDLTSLVQGIVFGLAYLIGLVPTLAANAINAGSPLKTTYGGQDVVPPDFSFRITGDYIRDLQGLLIIVAMVWAAAAAYRRTANDIKPVVVITAVNLAANLAFFLSHPIFTPYYLMPTAMLSLWSLLFGYLSSDRRSAPAGTVATDAVSPGRA